MCGIVGILNFDPGRAASPEELRRMNGLIRHRGPDEEGEGFFGHFGMAMRRLSVIGVATGRQPMSNEDGSVWVTFNGEVYNYRELRGELLKAGHRFKTASDTEALVHAYEEHGLGFAERLEGMFG